MAKLQFDNSTKLRKTIVKKEVKAFAPATVANVACGFDMMGFAIQHLGDEIIARFSETPGLHISKITGDDGRLPTAVDKNTAGMAVQALRYHLGISFGIELEIHKKMPLASGMGSSAASAVAAVVAINELMGNPLSREALLPFAMQGETVASGVAHADNIAPALLGGIVLIRSYNPLDIIPLPSPPDLQCALLHPKIAIRTNEARGLLPKNISLKDALTQVGNLGGLVAGLFSENYELIGRSLQDVIAEPRRAKLIPGFAKIKQAAIKAGALGCSISGSGPTIFALSTSANKSEKIGKAMQEACQQEGLDSNVYLTAVNQKGAYIVNQN